MNVLSREVKSNQTGIHNNLKTVVQKHLNSQSLRPIAAHTEIAFQNFVQHYKGQALIFDSGCGTARSSLMLAHKYPNALVVGIDKSAARLEKFNNRYSDDVLKNASNLHIVRADYEDFLKIAAREKLKLSKHKLLYPNPWPKSQHLQRRWHGSAIFKTLLGLGGEIELRSNWKIYVQEFQQALLVAGHQATIHQLSLDKDNFISDFEQKYHKSQQTLWQLRCQL